MPDYKLLISIYTVAMKDKIIFLRIL